MEPIAKILSPIKDGVQGIILVKKAKSLLTQNYLLIQDHDDRGLGTGIRKLGLPGGGIEYQETPDIALVREIEEESSLNLAQSSLKYEKFGCYTKMRSNGFPNDNHLFVIKLDYFPELKTNDPFEVSKVVVLQLWEIINYFHEGRVHEGSMRLICHFLNGTKSGSLNEPVSLSGTIF